MAIDNYYNRFDPKKGYKKLLFRAGYGLQSAELNELQATLKSNIKHLTSHPPFLLSNFLNKITLAAITPKKATNASEKEDQ